MGTIYHTKCDVCGYRVRSEPEPDYFAFDTEEEYKKAYESWEKGWFDVDQLEGHCCGCYDGVSDHSCGRKRD